MKAQTEIFGLIVIVLLVTVGLLFAVGFLVKKPPATLKQDYQSSEVGYNTLAAILGTNIVDVQAGTPTFCHQLTVTELIQDCAENNPSYQLSCGASASPELSCEYIEKLINGTFFRETLDKWHYKYQLTIKSSVPSAPTVIKVLKNAECTERKRITYIVPSKIGDLEIYLDLC